MKRWLWALIVLPLLVCPTISSAQQKIAEEWTTYCDNGVEKVRVAFTYELIAVGFVANDSEWFGAYTEPCAGLCGPPETTKGVRKPLGNDRYKWTWQGWTRACLAGQVWRSAMMSYITNGENGPENRQFFVQCDEGPQTIVDESNCNILPVASSTWGRIKALYR